MSPHGVRVAAYRKTFLHTVTAPRREEPQSARPGPPSRAGFGQRVRPARLHDVRGPCLGETRLAGRDSPPAVLWCFAAAPRPPDRRIRGRLGGPGLRAAPCPGLAAEPLSRSVSSLPPVRPRPLGSRLSPSFLEALLASLRQPSLPAQQAEPEKPEQPGEVGRSRARAGGASNSVGIHRPDKVGVLADLAPTRCRFRQGPKLRRLCGLVQFLWFRGPRKLLARNVFLELCFFAWTKRPRRWTRRRRRLDEGPTCERSWVVAPCPLARRAPLSGGGQEARIGDRARAGAEG